jgi:chromosome segregation ATPase
MGARSPSVDEEAIAAELAQANGAREKEQAAARETAALLAKVEKLEKANKSLRQENVSLCAKVVDHDENAEACAALDAYEKEVKEREAASARDQMASDAATIASLRLQLAAHAAPAALAAPPLAPLERVQLHQLLAERDELLEKFNKQSDEAGAHAAVVDEQESAIAGLVAKIDELEQKAEQKDKRLAAQKGTIDKLKLKVSEVQAEVDKLVAGHRLRVVREDRKWRDWTAAGGPTRAPAGGLPLCCPRADKDEVKKLGAEWNGRQWCVKEAWPLRDFALWLP